MKRVLAVLGIVFVAGVSACSSRSDAVPDTAAATAAGTSEAAGDGGEAKGLTAEITITDGAKKSTYRIPEEFWCVDLGPKGHAATFMGGSDAPLPALQQAGFERHTSAAGPTDDFLIAVKVSDETFKDNYRIEPKKGLGSGTSTVTPGTGRNYSVNISGKTAAGVGLEAVFNCRQADV